MATADDETAAALAWLDGLAGRPAARAAADANPASSNGDNSGDNSGDREGHRDSEVANATDPRLQGQRLRVALLGAAETRGADTRPGQQQAAFLADAEWQALLHRALPQQAANEESGAAATDASVRAQGANTKAAAWPQRAWAAAAGVGALALLLNLVPRETEEAPAASSHPTGAAKDAAGLRGGGGSDSALWRSKQPTQDAARLADALRAAGAEVALVAGPEGSVRLAITAAPDARAASNALLAELETALGVDGQLTLHVVPLTPSPSSKPP